MSSATVSGAALVRRASGDESWLVIEVGRYDSIVIKCAPHSAHRAKE